MRNRFSILLEFAPFRILYRLSIVARYFSPGFARGLRWSVKKTENSNFYYALEETNRKELASALGLLFGVGREAIEAFFDEIEGDDLVRDHLEAWRAANPRFRDSSLLSGRRIVWYAIARLTRPKVILETGVFHGVGSVILIRALMRNGEEGFNGEYLGTEINPRFGELVSGEFLARGTVMYGDSIESITQLGRQVDMFISDSDHNHAYERAELKAVAPLLSKDAVVIGDNSHGSPELVDWSLGAGRDYVFLAERAKEHFYRGGGIGISVPASSSRSRPASFS